MLKLSDVKIPILSDVEFKSIIANKLRISENDVKSYKIIKKSLDARKKGSIFWVYVFAVSVKNEEKVLNKKISNVCIYNPVVYEFNCKQIATDIQPVIIGTGPSGLFCALMLIRAGLKPVLIERGQTVDDREKTIEAFWKTGILNSDSNVQFGEGGAGTFSDGKLTCGVNDKRTQFVLKEFVKMGAPEEICYISKPHIGTDYLKKTVENMRNEIIAKGGKFIFNTLMTNIEVTDGNINKITLKSLSNNDEYKIDCKLLILATGHSSRDTYHMLHKSGLNMQKKPFSVGVRIEHKREYINLLQYKTDKIARTLPAADYKLSCHPDGRGAYTFCMCPGGVVVAGASEPFGVVTNGMSYYERNEANSNSAVLVSVLPEDIPGDNPMNSIDFQRQLEHNAFLCGGENYYAPCQKVSDFIKGRPSTCCGSIEPSYRPGVKYTDLSDCLPGFVCETLKKALLEFDKKIPGFCINDALLTGVETRSSAPVRINRNENMESNIKGIFPIGEGAGYAGGIMSSAIDGIKCAEKIVEILSF